MTRLGLAAILLFAASLPVAAKTMTGINGHRVEALPHDMLREVLKKYNRLAEPKSP